MQVIQLIDTNSGRKKKKTNYVLLWSNKLRTKWITQTQRNGLLFSVKDQGHAESYSVITKTKLLWWNG